MKAPIMCAKSRINWYMPNPLRTRASHFPWVILTVCLTLTHLVQAEDPEIKTQPTNQVVSLGGTAQFRVAALTTEYPLTYQWQHTALNLAEGFTNLPSATGTLLRFSTVADVQAGDYRVVVTNAIGNSVTSQVATLTVDPTFIKITKGPLVEDAFASFHSGRWGDIDGDGLLDVMVSGGDAGNVLNAQVYRNHGDCTFTRTSALPPEVLWADFDNDGDLDAVNGLGFSSLAAYVNDGQGNFNALSGSRLLGTQKWPGGNVLCLADYDADGFVDVMVQGTTADWNQNKRDFLLRNLGNWTFEVVTNTAWSTIGSVEEVGAWVDLNQDGWADLVAIGQPSRLLMNRGGGVFTKILDDPLVLKSDAYQGGVVPVDFDNDGDFDLLVGRLGNPCEMYQNDGTGRFTQIELPPITDVQGHGLDGYSWGDFDNDGDLDLWIGYFGRQCRLFENQGDGTFAEIFPGSPVIEVAHTCVSSWVDVDNDGFLDLFVANGATYGPEKNFLYRNNLGNKDHPNHWLKVKLVGTISNRDGIGATVRTFSTIGGKSVKQTRLVGSTMISTDLSIHFGLGNATKVDMVRIEWPSGVVQELKDVAVDQQPYLTVVEMQNAVSQPEILSSRRASDGTFQATVKNASSAKLLHVLEASTDLAKWTKLQVRTNLVGTMEFTDSSTTNAAARFYRVAVP